MPTISTVSNSIQNCLSDIQQRLYSFQEKLCSTDNKIYAFLILGRVLQAAAIASFAASIAFAFTVGPIVLLAAIPAIALGLLGTYVAGNPEELNDMLQMARPFVPGQPVGLVNGGNNCWLNSSLQLMANIPAAHHRMRQIPQLAQFLDAYEANRNNYQKVGQNIDTHAIRQFVSRETGGVISDGSRQEDAAEFFDYVFQGPNALYQLDHQVNGVVRGAYHQSLLHIGLGTQPRPSFQQLFNSYFDDRAENGARIQFFFQRPPNDLLVSAKRFYGQIDSSGNNHIQTGKIGDAIDVPERLALSNQFVRVGGGSEYVCDAFSVHNGSSLESGHYICYVKRQNTWWYCSDTRVYEVSAGTALRAMKYGYIFHYAKCSP
jgi:hypothetical protein